MLLKLEDLMYKYNMQIKGVLHVGAHLAEEAELYNDLGIQNVYWVEGNPDNVPAIERAVSRYDNWVIQALVTDRDREPTTFHITNYDSMSSSILEFGTHTQFSPDTVFVDHRVLESRTLDSLWKEYQWFPRVNFLNMDLQGAELLALKGASEFLAQVDYIYTEVNNQEVYQYCAKVEELDRHLIEFDRVETGWVGNQGWGDALYLRTTHA